MSKENGVAVKSVVRVHFEASNTILAYFNDAFNLQVGDIVFVEGKLEGQRGRVIDITYNFKIKVSDYKRVIGKADTDVHGELHMAGSHFVTFDPEALPYQKVLSWYKAPEQEGDAFLTGNDDTSFPLDDFNRLKVKPEVFERGRKYYLENKVRYLCIEGNHGRAIVEGTKPYEVEFNDTDNQISGLVCDCFCSDTCKHEVAALLQLREMLAFRKEKYPDQLLKGDYIAAVNMETFFLFAIDGKKRGKITM